MPIILEAHYCKKVGLPQYSSHSFSLTVQTEIADMSQVDAESRQLYSRLQAAVDREIQSTGYLPDVLTAGENLPLAPSPVKEGVWQCTSRQRELILAIAEERKVPMVRVEQLAQENFGCELRALTRAQASRIITQLLTV